MSGSLIVGDFNGDSLLDLADWTILRTNQLADLSGLTSDQAYERGDLNRDFRNDHADFAEFKAIFDGQNGAGAFAAMVAEVPEPSTAALSPLPWRWESPGGGAAGPVVVRVTK